jgi:hypothetical protein
MKRNKSTELTKNINNFINQNQIYYNNNKTEKDILPIPNLQNYTNANNINIIDYKSIPYNKYNNQNVNLKHDYHYPTHNAKTNISNSLEMSNNSQEASLLMDDNEKNIFLLSEKVKEQEQNIIYLNNRLQNYDITMNEITKLNIELNTLNEIIWKKNKTIQEFRDISDLSKLKFEELLKKHNDLIQKINLLQEENEKLKKIQKNDNVENFNKIKEELTQMKIENNELKNKIREKEEIINGLNKKIEELKIKSKSIRENIADFKENKSTLDLNSGLIFNYDNENGNLTYNMTNTENKFNDIKSYNYMKKPFENEKLDNNYSNINNRYKGYSLVNIKLSQERRNTPLNMIRNRGFPNIRNKNYFYYKDNSIRTEPSYINLDKKKDNLNKMHGMKNRCNFLNKKEVDPLDYSYYLLDNLKDNICTTYTK